MKKVIIKCRVENLDEFFEKLNEQDIELGPPYWQHERVYIPRNYKKRNSFPRVILRTEVAAVDQPAKYEMEVRRHIEDSGVDIVDTTAVTDYAEAAEIVVQLGFEQQAEIARRRQRVAVEDDKILVLDKIDTRDENYVRLEWDLGKKAVGEVKMTMMNVLAKLGLDESAIETETDAEKM